MVSSLVLAPAEERTPSVTRSRWSSPPRRTQDRRPVMVGHGQLQFPTIRAAVDEIEYPLVGVAHTDVLIPRAEALRPLREELLERYTEPRCWRGLYWMAARRNPHMFERYTLVTMPQASNAIPAGTHAFRMEWNARQVDSSDMASLTVDQRGQVYGAVNDGKLHFPVADFDHVLMRPVFAENDGRLGPLMDADAIVREAARMEAALHNFCYYQAPIVRLARWTAAAVIQSRNLVARIGAGALEAPEFVGMTVQDIAHVRARQVARRAARAVQMEEYLFDPIWAVVEPSWRVKHQAKLCPTRYARGRLDFLRRIVHWIDDQHNVVTLRVGAELASVA